MKNSGKTGHVNRYLSIYRVDQCKSIDLKFHHTVHDVIELETIGGDLSTQYMSSELGDGSSSTRHTDVSPPSIRHSIEVQSLDT